MTDRQAALRAISVGDIFHAEAPNGASLICLALSITETTIRGKTVTTQFYYDFDRTTGIAESGDERIPCRIDSVAPLPLDIHETMMSLDRKFSQEDNGDPTQFWLTDRERRGLLFVADFYPANPI
jgi:hypothetical protein